MVIAIGVGDPNCGQAAGLGAKEHERFAVRRFARAEIPGTGLELRERCY
jgi:hypothetical protein